MARSQNAKDVSFTGKLNHVGETIFSTINKLAAQHQALNLSQGFPDFDAHADLVALVHQKMAAGHNQYAPMPGTPELRETLAQITQEDYGATYSPQDEVTITAGATQAIGTAIATSIREGDEVILISPAYDCYIPMIELNGGIPVTVKLVHPEYHIDWDQLKKLLNHRTRMIIINTPHNPTGSVWQKDDLDQLEQVVANSNIIVLADEVYENIIYNGQEHHSIRTREALRKRSFVIGSLGKTLHVTGWKVGYVMAPPALTAEFRKVHQYLVFSVNTPVQLALAEFLQQERHRRIGEFYQEKQALFLDSIAGSRFTPLSVNGGYFQILDYSAITDEGDVKFAERLITEHGIASIPLSVFYRFPTDHKVLRFCFAKDDATLVEAGKILQSI